MPTLPNKKSWTCSRLLLQSTLALLLGWTIQAAAQDKVAVAAPMQEISVDGDLSDWPEGIQRYPLDLVATGALPESREDFHGWFQVGYDPDQSALYVAVEIGDQSTVVDTAAGAGWNTQDGCELYLSTSDNRVGGEVFQYAVWGDFDVGTRGEGQLAFTRGEGRHRYEWRLDAAGKGIDLREGAALGLDVAAIDRDADDSFSWMKWGQGKGRAMGGGLGEVILIPAGTRTGELRGVIRWQGSDRPIPRSRVWIQSLTRENWQWQVRTDRQGQFAMHLPEGTYRLATAANPEDGVSTIVEVRAGGAQTELELPRSNGRSAPMGAGTTMQAGSGTIVEASFGIQKGLWRTYGLPDGLASTVIDAIFQDRAGYLWFGTQGGVSRYDGQRFTTFTIDDGLAYNGVSAIAEDGDGNLWFGTWGGGISRYDGQAFTTFTTDDGLAHDVVLSILRDRDDNLWFGTQGGVSRYDARQDVGRQGIGQTFTTFTTDDGLTHDEISVIAQDSDGNLWFGTWGGGVSHYDGRTFTSFTADDGLAHDEISVIAQDSDGNLWFGTQDGISRYDGQTFITFTTDDGLAYNAVSAIAEDRRGNLWFGTWEKGVSRYTPGLPVGQRFTTFTTDDGLAHDQVSAIAEDGDGNLWFGTWGGGISRYDGVNFSHFTRREGLEDNRGSALLEDRNGSLWIGTQDGVSRYDGKNFNTFNTEDGLAHSAVNAIAEDGDGNLWIGTQGGVSRYDARQDVGQRFTTFTTDDGLAHSWVNAIAEDADGNLWFGTWGGGISRYDGQRFTTFTTDDGLAHNWVNCITLDRQGDLWFGTKGGGVSRYDGKSFNTLTADDGLAANWIWTILEDRLGALWFATDGGASRYDGKTFNTFTDDDGLSSTKVSAILQDRQGQFWFGTRGGGVSRYDGQVFQSLLVRDGLTDNTVSALLEDANGNMWIATDRGVTLLRARKDAPPIHLADVVADRRYGPVGEIELPTSQDYIAFEFQGISFKTRPGALLYRYRLEGYDTAWQLTNLNRVEYLDLPLGDYLFEVAAIDRDLNLSTEPVQVQLKMHPPYGDIALYATLFVVLLGLAWQAGQIVQRNRKLRIAHREAEEARHEADAANEAKSAFLANMSHEIRTPMNGIVGMVDMIKRTPLEKNQLNFLSIIDTSADALLELINDILDLSKIEAGSMELEEVDFVLWEVLEGVMKLMAMRAHEKHLELACHIAPDVPEGLKGDPTRLRQIVVNLIGNAIKFTSEGEIGVHVTRVEQTEAEIELHIAVSDTGIGIPKDKQNLIFEAFSQADSSTTRQFGGTGLGLNISRQLVELMHGRIWLESEPGEGSTFQFTARFGPSQMRADEIAAEPWRQLGEMRILAVDHSATNRKSIEEMLTRWGFQVATATNGAEALAELERAQTYEEPYDLALVEGMMPSMSGLEMAQYIDQRPGLVRHTMMLLTSLDDQSYVDQLGEAGVRHYLRKPITQSDLLDGILTALGPEAGLTGQAVGTHTQEDLPPLYILLADDNPTNQYVATSMLEEAGHRVVTADNGRIVVEQWEGDSFDLILMDVQMPEMDGYEATGTIRQREQESGAHIPIIGLTANAMKGDREACLDAGMDDYVPKPVRWEALREAIVRLDIQPKNPPPPALETTEDILQDAVESPETAGGTSDAPPEDDMDAMLAELGLDPLDDGEEEPPAEIASDLLARLDEEFDDAAQDVVLDESALIDMKEMEARGSISVQKMVDLFDQGAARILPMLSQLLAAGQGADLQREAHTLKGSARDLGARRLAGFCQQLEDMGREGEYDDAEGLIERIDDAFTEAREAIRDYLGQ